MAAGTKLTAVHFRQIHERSDEDVDKFELSKEDMDAYNDWVQRLEGLPAPIWDEAVWINQVLQTNYHDPQSLDELLRMQEHAKGTRVVIGESGGVGYSILISRAILKPTAPPISDSSALMPPELLGFVRNVSVGNPKVGNLRTNEPVAGPPNSANPEVEDTRKDSIANIISKVSIGNDDTGFIFFQLGGFEVAEEAQWSSRFKGVSENNLTWRKSPHVLCIRIRDNGRGSSVYMMPTKHTRTEPFDASYTGVRVSDTLEGVGGTRWFCSNKDPDEICPLYEYVSAMLKQHGKGPRIVREFIPYYPGELEDSVPSSPASSICTSSGESGRDGDSEGDLMQE